jgi:hypothetical protein
VPEGDLKDKLAVLFFLVDKVHDFVFEHRTPDTNPDSIGPPPLAWSLVPVVGSAWTSINDFQNGRYRAGTVNAALAISDLFLVKGAVKSAGKGVLTLGVKAAAKETPKLVAKRSGVLAEKLAGNKSTQLRNMLERAAEVLESSEVKPRAETDTKTQETKRSESVKQKTQTERERNKGACFVAGTKLLTPQGSKRIEEFVVGDQLLSRCETGVDWPVTVREVEEVFVVTAQVVNLHVNGQVIRTTAEHPFWVAGKGWVPASSLRVGDLLSSHDGRWVAVEAVVDTGEWETVYNIRVAEDHTYFVAGDEWGFSIWAHNACYTAKDTGSGTGLFGIFVTNRVGLDEWIKLNGRIREWNPGIARSLAAELNDLSKKGPGTGGNTLGPDCSQWARVYMDDHGGTMEYIYTKPPLPQRSGKLPKDTMGPYQYHAFARIGDKLYDELHPTGISVQDWTDAYRPINQNMTVAEFTTEMYLGPTPPTNPRPQVS